MFRVLFYIVLCSVLVIGQPPQEGGVIFSGNYYNNSLLPAEQRSLLILNPQNWFVLVERFEIEFDISFYDYRSVGTVLHIGMKTGENYVLTVDSSLTPGISVLSLYGPDGRTGIEFQLPHKRFTLNYWSRLKISFYHNKNEIRCIFGKEDVSAAMQLPRHFFAKLSFGAVNRGKSAAFALRNVKVREYEATDLYGWTFRDNNVSGFTSSRQFIAANTYNIRYLLPLYYSWEKTASVAVGSPFSSLTADTAAGLVVFTTPAGKIAAPYRGQHTGLASVNKPYRSMEKPFNTSLPFTAAYPDCTALSAAATVFSDSLTGRYYTTSDKSGTPAGRLVISRGGNFDFPGMLWQPRSNAGFFYSGEPGVWYMFGGINQNRLQAGRPEPFLDLYRIDLKDSSALRIWMLPSQQKLYPAAPVCSPYFDEAAQQFFCPLYVDSVDNSASSGLIRLARFSLHTPEYTLLGDSTRFANGDLLFYDFHEAAFYIIRREPGDRVSILRLLYPPLSTAELAKIIETENTGKIVVAFLLNIVLPIVIVMAGIFIFSLYKRNRLRPAPLKNSGSKAVAEQKSVHTATSGMPGSPAITLFGNFMVTMGIESDSAGKLTSKPEEMLVALLLTSYPLKGSSRGLTDSQMADYLWPDLPSENFANNKKVTLSKLNKFLAAIPAAEVSKEQGVTRIRIGAGCLCDYARVVELLRGSAGSLPPEEWREFYQLTAAGSFLGNLDYDWLEQYRIDVTEEVITRYFDQINVARRAGTYGQIAAYAEIILRFDTLNEVALICLLQQLHKEGKFNQIKAVHEKYSAEYLRLFGTPYKHSSSELISREKTENN